MALTTIFPGVYELALGPVNVFFIEDGPQLTLIDTGYEHKEQPILDAAQSLGKRPADITNIVVTHCHPDHAGSLAALKQQTQASVWMHHADAEVVRGNIPMRRSTPSPGLLNHILYRIFIKNVPAQVPQAVVDHEISDGDQLPLAGGLKAIHAPGHSAGHMTFVLPRDGGLLFAADACSNLPMLGYSIVYDDHAEGRRSLAKLATLDVSAICFGHGRALKQAGVRKFQQKWRA
jgi:glyoxylase-like metal-dependent hydrolase (beta-lactamase superfamily II)